MRPLIRLGCALALAATAAVPALAAAQTRIELQGARSYMDQHGTNAAFVEAVFQPGQIGSSRFTWSPDVSIGYIDGRNLQRYRNSKYTTSDDIKLVAAGVRLHYGDADDWYQPLYFSFQPAAIDGRTQALSSGYQFVSTLGWQFEHFNLAIRHISNGSLKGPNRGETMAVVGFAFDL